MPASRRIRVITWNVRAAIGPGPFPDSWWRRIEPDRLAALADLLRDLDADVVALQECAVLSVDGATHDTAGNLARAVGLPHRFAATRHFGIVEADGRTSGAGLFGNALLTRRPIGTASNVALPMAASHAFVEAPGADHPMAGVGYADAPEGVREPRCLLLAELGGITTGTTHFSHVGPGERLLQAAATVAAFGDASPALLLGDLNATIASPELAPLAGWTDGFDLPVGDAGRKSTDDGAPIDQVLVRGASVTSCRVVREAGDLSDHYPVIAEIELR